MVDSPSGARDVRSALRVSMLGGLHVSREGEDFAALPSMPVRAAMLVYLCVERRVTRDAVCALLWPDRDASRARRSLSQTLLELRRDLGGDWVDTERQQLAVTDLLTTDLHALERAVERDDVESAAEIYSGPFLAGVHLGHTVEFERWVDQQRSNVHRLARTVLKRRALEASDPQSAVATARDWVELDPLDDESNQRLIEALDRAGLRSRALERYAAFESSLAEELQVEPLDEMRALVEVIRNRTTSAPPSDSAPAPPPIPKGQRPARRSEPLPDDFTVTREIGRGSTGPVYLAREPALRRLVAVKVLDEKLAGQPEARARFVREAQVAARVAHANVPGVHRLGTTRIGTPFIVMEYIEGVTLAQRLRATGPMEAAEVRRVVAQVACALAAAHAAGVIHRDVRPANVLCRDDSERVYLVDFGLAGALESADPETVRLTRSGELLGNPEYISPEQARGEPLTDRSDVYSLGVMARALLTGNAAKPDEGPAGTGQDVGDPELSAWIERATAKNPRHRPSAERLTGLASTGGEAGVVPGRGGLFIEVWKRRMLPFIGGYLAIGGGAMTGVDQLVQQEILEPLAYRVALATFVAGLNATIVAAWYHGAKGRQRVTATETAILFVIGVSWLVAMVLLIV